MNEFFVDVNNNEFLVNIKPGNKVEISGKELEYEIRELNSHHFSLKLNERMFDVIKVNKNKNKVGILLNGNYFETVVQTKLEKIASQIISLSEKAHHRSEVHSPMPGMVLKIKRKIGEEVNIGDSVLILEAMKMENDIKSPFSGRIKEILVSENIPVEKGAVLFRIE
jgi:biotin carboxyl carrier protein